ncbi:MAG: hypothetical protein JWN25_733 [Verrucomicrobiales bacterium]|nr:hypothetical protein [Verrucomicrobiales bacterium]
MENTAPPTRFDPKVLACLEGLDFKARYVMEGFLSGLHESPFHGYSVEFSDYRNYQPGDDLRHLDWKLYGRTDRLCIKRYMQETNVRFYLVCDTSASMAYKGSRGWESKFGCARILSAALSWFLLKQNDAVGLIAMDAASGLPRLVRPSQRSTQTGLLLREMEQIAPGGNPSLAALLGHALRLVHRRSVILLFSDLLEPSAEIEQYLKQLRFHGHECIVFQTLDPDESEFPFADSHVFEDLETGSRHQVLPGSARDKYLQRFNAFMEDYRQLFQRLEIPHCTVFNHQDPWPALALFLSERRKLQ